ncbi:type II toxin-antitoxin system mRNA interferase toxin, RelE/StbE family [Candidatus Falkowbacteria bacterium]|nr:type II toxin-antitoxin system mRNA interferase toxin, RelE/StbE family [Candidatus Falkowbacteria bacterium]
MMFKTHKNFDKQFTKLPPKIKRIAQAKIELFTINPKDPMLRDHPLSGNLTGLRAFSVTGDVRVVYELYKNELVVLFIAIGTHNQLYK